MAFKRCVSGGMPRRSMRDARVCHVPIPTQQEHHDGHQLSAAAALLACARVCAIRERVGIYTGLLDAAAPGVLLRLAAGPTRPHVHRHEPLPTGQEAHEGIRGRPGCQRCPVALSPSVACQTVGRAPRNRGAGPSAHVGVLHNSEVQGVDVSVSHLSSRNSQHDDTEASSSLRRRLVRMQPSSLHF